MSIRPLSNYGERLAEVADPDAVGIQVVANPSAKQASPPIEIDRFCRNGQHPSASFQNQLNNATNAAVLYRSKQLFALGDHLTETQAIGSFGIGDRHRYRFAFKASAYCHAIYCVVVMRQPSSGGTNNTYGRLDLFSDTAESSLVTSQTFAYGADGGTLAGWVGMKAICNFVDGIDPLTNYYARFSDVDYGRMLSMCVFELTSMTEHAGGYLGTATTTHSPVVTLHRELPATISNNLWQTAGSAVWNWSVNDGTAPLTTTSATLKNIIDMTSTGAPTAATPGATLDMTGKDRLSQTSGVPCVLKAFGKNTGAGATGTVYLKDASNTTIASVNITATTSTWVSTTFNLPATVAKYDLQFATVAGTLSLYAVSIWEEG